MTNITAINDDCYRLYIDQCLGTNRRIEKMTDIGNGLRYYHRQTNPNYGEGKVWKGNCILMNLNWQSTNCCIKLISTPDVDTIPLIKDFLQQLWNEDESHTYFVFEDLPFNDCLDDLKCLFDYLDYKSYLEKVYITEDLF